MEIKAQLNHLHIAPRKVRLVCNLVKKMPVNLAVQQLTFMRKIAAKPLIKLINSAVANAEHNKKLKVADLYIKNIIVNDGFTLKRWKPRAMGRATMIRKRASHVSIVLAEKEINKVKTGKEIKKSEKETVKEQKKENIKKQ